MLNKLIWQKNFENCTLDDEMPNLEYLQNAEFQFEFQFILDFNYFKF